MDALDATRLMTAQYTFDAMVAGMVAQMGGPPPSSLSQAMTDSASVVVPLLQAASALVQAVQSSLSDHDVRLVDVEAAGGMLTVALANAVLRIDALEARMDAAEVRMTAGGI